MSTVRDAMTPVPLQLKPSLLIIGARDESLGHALYNSAEEFWDVRKVWTAGISGEQYKLDVANSDSIRRTLEETLPDWVVCTVGVNEPMSVGDTFLRSKMSDAFHTNVIGPMEVLRQFLAMDVPTALTCRRKFVFISSNSAHIPRTRSLAYCASKAALSMAVRCAAREVAKSMTAEYRPLIWGYEPGLLATGQSVEVHEALGVGLGAMHRMPGIESQIGLDPALLADRILGDLMLAGEALNGCMIPFDAGEV